MKKSQLKQLVKGVLFEIGAPEGKFTHISKKPTLHLSYYNNKFVPVTPDDQKLLDDEFQDTWGTVFTAKDLRGAEMESSVPMRYLTWKDVADMMSFFNLFLTQDN
jgi:hypothetical protein